MIIAVDAGNCAVKAMSVHDRVTFPRFVMNATNRALENENEQYKVEINGKNYFVGELARVEGGTSAFDKNKATHAHTIPLILTAVAILSGNFEKVDLVTGLPLGDLGTQRNEFMKQLEGPYEVSINNQSTQFIHIKRVIVFGEGAGALWDSVMNLQGNITRKVAEWERVIDIGYKTTDLCALNKMHYVANESTSLPLGIAQAQMRTYKRVIAERDILPEEVVPDTESLQWLANQIMSRVNRLWRSRDNIFLAGGGAHLLKDHLKHQLIKEPQWANVAGYLKVGAYKWGL